MSDAAALAESYRHCHRVARGRARNFYYGFLLLPHEPRRSMCALYAFLRRCDDLADDDAPPQIKRERIDRLRDELERAFNFSESALEDPFWPALVESVRKHGIPLDYLRQAIDGVVMDIEPNRYDTFDQLYEYCYRVASVVGLCCLHIWGYNSENGRAEQLAERCGVAFQLTNIVRDVREDAQRGRVYLPGEDLARFGVEPDELLAARMNDRVRALLAFECLRAENYYRAAQPLQALIKPVGRPMLRAMVGIYSGLLRSIIRGGYEVFERRVSLSPWRKATIALRSLAGGR